LIEKPLYVLLFFYTAVNFLHYGQKQHKSFFSHRLSLNPNQVCRFPEGFDGKFLYYGSAAIQLFKRKRKHVVQASSSSYLPFRNGYIV
jgi:hypothetical protein